VNAIAIAEPTGDMAAAYRAKFAQLTTEQVREFGRSASLQIVQGWLDLAYAVAELELRGEQTDTFADMADNTILPVLRRIAHGQICPELAKRFNMAVRVIEQFGRLPKPEQLKIAAGKGFPVVVPSASGERHTRMMIVEDMRELWRQVFDFQKCAVRNEAAQHAYLDRRLAKAAPPTSEYIKPFRVDAVQGCAFIGSRRIDRATLSAVLRALSKPE
jgi:hypothetical protein